MEKPIEWTPFAGNFYEHGFGPLTASVVGITQSFHFKAVDHKVSSFAIRGQCQLPEVLNSRNFEFYRINDWIFCFKWMILL
jgi:hypothetical protein